MAGEFSPEGVAIEQTTVVEQPSLRQRFSKLVAKPVMAGLFTIGGVGLAEAAVHPSPAGAATVETPAAPAVQAGGTPVPTQECMSGPVAEYEGGPNVTAELCANATTGGIEWDATNFPDYAATGGFIIPETLVNVATNQVEPIENIDFPGGAPYSLFQALPDGEYEWNMQGPCSGSQCGELVYLQVGSAPAANCPTGETHAASGTPVGIAAVDVTQSDGSVCPGYWISTNDGGVATFGAAPFDGDMSGQQLNAPVINVNVTPDNGGYWMVAQDGGIFSFGDAQFYGSMGGQSLNKPVVALAPTPDGKGYWEVASDGGIFAFGDAQFYGSMGGQHLNQPVVGIASTADGKGYWEVASDGGIFAFGDAQFYGSMGGQPLNAPVIGISTDPSAGSGAYREVASDGGVFDFGGAQFYGSNGGNPTYTVENLGPTPDGEGYYLVGDGGQVAAFGDAVNLGNF